MEIQPHGCCFDACSCVYASLSLPWPVLRPAVALGCSWRSIWLFVARPLVVPGSSSGVLGPSVGLQFPVLPGVWETYRSSSFEVMDPVFLLPLLVAPSLEAPQRGPARFCGWLLSLSSLRAGVCSHLWERRVPVRVLLVAWLPLPRVWRSAPSYIALMLCASTGSPVNPGLS